MSASPWKTSCRRQPETGTGHQIKNGIDDIPGNSSIAWKETKAMLKDERFGKVTFTRRDALKIAGAAGMMAALPWSGITEAEAAAPALKGPQAGGYYRTRAAAEGLRVLGYHLPFPGIGHVRTAKGGAFEWAPEPWNWTTA